MHSRNLFAVPALLLLLSMCTPPAYDPPPPQLTAGALSDAYGTATAAAKGTETRTITPTATVTLTPCCGTPIVEVTPCPDGAICEVYSGSTDEDILSRLCVVEARGMAEKRRAACLSVLSTVGKRMYKKLYSDGTVSGTITWGCTPEAGCKHFPGHVVNGCEGVLAEACAWSYPTDIAYFQAVARDFLNGDLYSAPGICADFTFYGSRPGIDDKDGACIIKSDNGQWIGFYD